MSSKEYKESQVQRNKASKDLLKLHHNQFQISNGLRLHEIDTIK